MQEKDNTINDIYNKPKDADYLLKEIQFFMEAFHRESYDRIALMIARTINSFLKANGDYHSILDFLTDLESYAAKSHSDDFVWELVYIRRALLKILANDNNNVNSAIDCSIISAKHFDKICEIVPSVHNYSCRILENLTIVDHLKRLTQETEKKQRIREVLDNCERLLREIKVDENTKLIYFQTGYLLYFCRATNLSISENMQFADLTNLIDYAYKVYVRDIENFEVLKILTLAYVDISKYSQFSYEDEKEHIKNLFSWLDEAIANGNEQLKRAYDNLKKALKIYTV